MIRTFVYSLLLASILTSCAPARTATPPERTADETAVLMAVQQFFETMTANDEAGARAVLDPEGDFVSVRWDAGGNPVVRRSSNEDYLASLSTEPTSYLERSWASQVLIHGPIAVVWTPYDFHVDGAFSHCGVDAFQLLRTEAGWIITDGTYTVERTGCPESPLGPPEP